MVGWNLGPGVQGSPPDVGVWTATGKQLVVGKEMASLVSSVLNRPVSWSPRQVGGTVSLCTLSICVCLFVISFLRQDCLFI